MRSLGRILPWLAFAIAIGLAGEAMGCPNCKEALANQDGDAMRLADGYSWSILLMIAMPFALLGTGTMMVVRAVRRGSLPEF